MNQDTRRRIALLSCLFVCLPAAAAAPTPGEARELAAKALGDDVRDLVFVPITPCTVWDTRFASEPQSAGAIASGSTRRFFSHLDGAGGNFSTWGGNPSCAEASMNFIGGRPYAALMTVYVGDATSNGWLTLYRDGDPDPSSATISVYYSPGPTRTQTVVAKSSRGYGSGTFDIAATSRFGSVNASASITGYFLKAVNVNLPPSSAASGNVLKGGSRFLHNYGTRGTFLGLNAGSFGMSGSDNTAHGYNALAAISSGQLNTAAGSQSLSALATGTANTAVGASALFANSAGSYNTAVGALALYSVTGSGNIALGDYAGSNLTTGSDNIMIGHPGFAGEEDTIRIGNPALHNRAYIAGVYGRTPTGGGIALYMDGNGQLGTVSSSRAVKEDIADIDTGSARLMKLRPVSFHYRSHKAAGDLLPQYGLVAEEVAEAMPELVARGADGAVETVYYQFLPPMLLNEYQKQQRTIEALQAEVGALRARLERALEKLESR